MVPLKACKPRCPQHHGRCKADFPKSHLLLKKSLVVCRGLARKLKLKISGRRNAFGSIAGERSCEWQSATHPLFAAAFRSNTHTQPNYRVPRMAETHENSTCTNCKCLESLQDANEIKRISKLAQRVQRECTGYFCGYTFKVQPVGKKFLRIAAQNNNYLTDVLKDKTPGQVWHRATHNLYTCLLYTSDAADE